jgi:Ion channel
MYVYKLYQICSHTAAFCYLRSLYYIMTIMSTVGFGDVYPVTPKETLWMQVVIMSGVMLIGGIAAAFMGVFTEMDGRGEAAFKVRA